MATSHAGRRAAFVGPLDRSRNRSRPARWQEYTRGADALLTAEILSWSRTRGVFAGVSLQGATLRQDVGDNRDLYGRTLQNRVIIQQERPGPQPAQKLVALFEQVFGETVTSADELLLCGGRRR